MQQRYSRTLFGLLATALMGAFLVPAAASASQSAERPPTRYLVTIENLSNQPLTPPVLATHSASVSAFETGAEASPGIQGLAENGDVPGLVDELSSNPRMIGSVQVAEAGDVPPLEPGESVTVEIDALRRHRRLTIASMLICTNDGFAASEIRLPGRAGLQTSHYLNSYDAGTELNTEDFDDLVPPCGPLSGVDSGGAGTGASNPALAENGVITSHPGISGSGDLDAAVVGWDDPVAKVTVTRIDNAPRYEITISNTTAGQPFTPPVFVNHSYGIDLYDVGSPANSAIQGLAENGDVPGVLAAATGQFVGGAYVGDGPVVPGESQTTSFYAVRGIPRFTFASMLICSNDGFTGVDSMVLPEEVGHTHMSGIRGYDAGTELNTEDFDDIVPPCGPLSGVDSGGAGTGATNPALAENGVISLHPGITGDADLSVGVHGWDDYVGQVSITRVA